MNLTRYPTSLLFLLVVGGRVSLLQIVTRNTSVPFLTFICGLGIVVSIANHRKLTRPMADSFSSSPFSLAPETSFLPLTHSFRNADVGNLWRFAPLDALMLMYATGQDTSTAHTDSFRSRISDRSFISLPPLPKRINR